jgi:hypothetical protein
MGPVSRYYLKVGFEEKSGVSLFQFVVGEDKLCSVRCLLEYR